MAYEYDHDCPFEAFITNLGKYNEGELVGEWVKFPTTSEELQKVFERIGIGSKDEFGNPYEEWFISDYDCYVDGLYEKLGEYENLDELNYLASKLDELDDHDYNHFQAAMQISDYSERLRIMLNMPAFHPAGVVPTCVAISPTSVFTLSNKPERFDKIPSVKMPRNQSSIICHIKS